jgi:hypothetical protein
MLSPYEQEMVKAAHAALEETQQLDVFVGLDPEFMSIVIGSLMAAIDAVFAIRDGEGWRGKTDPREIAAELIRVAHLTDQN